jgi:hypothetical protein
LILILRAPNTIPDPERSSQPRRPISAVSHRVVVKVARMMTTRFTTTFGALALAVALGACGSDNGSSNDDVASVSDEGSNEPAQSDEEDAEQELLDWVECMRDEGIDIPDPTRDADGNLVISGNGIQIGGGERSGGATTNDDEGDGGEPPFTPEEMEAAQEVCGAPPGLGAGDISEEDLQAMQDQALEFAQCMRDNGIEDFPDPDFSNMGPGGTPQTNSDDSDATGGGEGPQVFLGPFGEIDLNDPEVAAAFEACQDLLGGDSVPPPSSADSNA